MPLGLYVLYILILTTTWWSKWFIPPLQLWIVSLRRLSYLFWDHVASELWERSLGGQLVGQRCLSLGRGLENRDQVQRKEHVMLPILNMLEARGSPRIQVWWAGEARERDLRAITVQILTKTTEEERRCGVRRDIGRPSRIRMLQVTERGACPRTKGMARGGRTVVLWSEYLWPPSSWIEILTPKEMVLGRWCLWGGDWVMRVDPSWTGWVPLKETPEYPSPLPPWDSTIKGHPWTRK